MIRRTFTLRDLFVVVTICGILFTLLLPFVEQLREDARTNQCEANLREFGIGFHTHADRDPQVRLTTGAFDYFRDGCPDTWGWVADVMKSSNETVGSRLCPSNPARGSETLLDLLAIDGLGASAAFPEQPDAKNEVPPGRLAEGRCADFRFTIDGVEPPESGSLATPAERFGNVQKLVKAGFNTNYAQSWFGARGTIRWLDDPPVPAPPDRHRVCHGNQLFFGGAMEGLKRRMAEKSKVPASAIAILCDGAASDRVAKTKEQRKLLRELIGTEQLAQSFGKGPVYFDENKRKFVTFDRVYHRGSSVRAMDSLTEDHLPLPSEHNDGGGDVNEDGQFDSIHNETFGGKDGKLWLQDTRAFGTVHRHQGEWICVFLTADGATRTARDLNGDRLVNPGFPCYPDGATDGFDYTNARCEVWPATMYNGPFIDDSWTKHRPSYIQFRPTQIESPPDEANSSASP